MKSLLPPRSTAVVLMMVGACLLGSATTLVSRPGQSHADISCGADVAKLALKLGSEMTCTFLKVSLRKMEFQGADLSGIILAESDLTRVDLRGANLSGANLMGSYLNHAKLEKANLSGTNLSWGQFWQADLQEANLRDADLSRAELRRANLRYADLRGARLEKAVLAVADLRGADLRGANLQDADFIKAKYDDSTRWPTSFNPSSTQADKDDD
ncbi:MAG: pentapeptide repeat-containing protein [Myxococcota bacterium]